MNIKKLSFCLLTLLNFWGCETGHSDPFSNMGFNAYDGNLSNRIAKYHDESLPNLANSKIGNPSLYIDFSSGIKTAFNDPSIDKLMSDCFNTLLTEKFDVYKLGSKQVTQLAISNTTQLGQKISNPDEYIDIWAPIQNAVEKIVESNNDALLITDFEEWQDNSEITSTAFLKIPFTKWLSKGNTVHFFIADYLEGNVSKHIFFTVFSCGNPNESSMISKLSSKLAALPRYDLSNKTYKLNTQYPSEKAGGIFYDGSAESDKAKNVLDLKDNYFNGLKNGNSFEFYPFGLDWKTIDDTHTAYKNQNQFNDFFRNLYIDLSNENAYFYGDFDVKVYDITNDFENYAKCNEAKNHKPKLKKGSNGQDKFSDDEKDEIALSCYNVNGKIKDEWIYKYTTSKSTALPEVFSLNQELFKNTKNANKNKVELGVAFDTKFNIKNISNPDGLIRIDIVLNTAEPNLTNPTLEKFKWSNNKGIINVALYESIKTTLQEVSVKPSNRTIYSYYIKTLQ
jgi:hypothetical protein